MRPVSDYNAVQARAVRYRKLSRDPRLAARIYPYQATRFNTIQVPYPLYAAIVMDSLPS